MAEERLDATALAEYITKNYLGKEVPAEWQVPEPYTLHWITMRTYSRAVSDDNPLFCDPAYGPKTRWGCQLAHPGIYTQLRSTQTHTGMHDKPWKVLNLQGGSGKEWFGVLRAGDTITTSCVMKSVETKQATRGLLYLVTVEGGIWNQRKELICKQWGTQVQVDSPEATSSDKDKGGRMMYERDEPYKYSQKEIDDICDAYEAETHRGSKPLYWEDVNEEDKLPKMVRGPLDMMDFTT